MRLTKRKLDDRPFSTSDLNLIVENFSNFQTLRDLCFNDEYEIATVLRVDVDHDLFGAVMLAKFLYKKAIQGTFFIRHDAEYSRKLFSSSERSDEANSLRTIIALGHEIGLHNNYIAQAVRGGGAPIINLEKDLSLLETFGIEIAGTSAHGDRLCHTHNFRNVEIFADRKRWTEQIRHTVIEDAVGQVKPLEYGLHYEAYDWFFEHYYCDVGGRFIYKGSGRGTQAPPPPEIRNGKDIVCILLHPIWWNLNSKSVESNGATIAFEGAGRARNV